MSIVIRDADTDGAAIVRVKAAQKGWTFNMVGIEAATSTLNSLYSKHFDGTTRSSLTCKYYDVSDVEITDPANQLNAVKMVLDYEPTYNYEIIGGKIQQASIPGSDLRVWVVAVPDIPSGSGGSKEMASCVNLKFIQPGDAVNADGRASKFMTYDATYHTNKLRFIFKHAAGLQHNVSILLETFVQ
jgi:hypothetical protein